MDAPPGHEDHADDERAAATPAAAPMMAGLGIGFVRTSRPAWASHDLGGAEPSSAIVEAFCGMVAGPSASSS